MRELLLVALLVFTGSASFAQEQVPAGSPERGYQAYMRFQCYTCHGTVGQGGDRNVGPKLAPDPIPYVGFEVEMRTPSRDMPAYRKSFVSDQDLADMYAYLLSIKPGPAVKDIPLLNF